MQQSIEAREDAGQEKRVVRLPRHQEFSQEFHQAAAGQRVLDEQPVAHLRFTNGEQQYRQPTGETLPAENDQGLLERVDAACQSEHR
ncbi:hypothetical protein SDC9_169652 [bioreactor metagenome]|uniref:Uncharacterized protein n=1 Tax=bioreactor metagenome TaxID=1076179 RepID=A0A645G8Z6_9ZZZZ